MATFETNASKLLKSNLKSSSSSYKSSQLLCNQEIQQQQQQQKSNTCLKSLDIKTKSIENTLLPLVNQISTFVNFKDILKPSLCTERTINALLKVGEAVNLAVERFVIVGETIALEHNEIKNEMLEACQEARNAGLMIKNLIDIKYLKTDEINDINNNNSNHDDNLSIDKDRLSIAQSATNLLNAVIKVLLLADVVVIAQILNAKNKVLLSLNKLETVNTGFWVFIKLFTQYGSDMIELAHLTGERQNDLKDDKRRSQLQSARWILERSTIMVLTASKTYFKHPECETAKENLNVVFSFIKRALEAVHNILIDSGLLYESIDYNAYFSPINDISFIKAYRQLEDTLEMIQNNMINESNIYGLLNISNSLIESTQDFTDSLYINNEGRDKILKLQNDIKEQINLFLTKTNDEKLLTDNQIQYTRLFKATPILNSCEFLKQILQTQSIQIANNLFKENKDATLLNLIKTYASTSRYDLLLETLEKFQDYSEQVLELCKMLRHISPSEILHVSCEHNYNVFSHIEKMIPLAAETYALFSSCKIAQENLNLYCEAWENQINNLSILYKELQEFLSGTKPDKSVYLSLPRPGKHGTSARVTSTVGKANKLDLEEQSKIKRLGIEMQLLTSEIEEKADKWNDPQNEIVKLAKIMSDMTYSIHLFTKGEGNLKTTQDLFAKATDFLQQGVILYAIIKEFTNSVPNGHLKDELIQLLEKLPIHCQQLKNKLKTVTVGKSATFNKVDGVIQESRDIMILVAKLVSSCFLCSSKYNIDYNSIAFTTLPTSTTINNSYLLNNNKISSLTNEFNHNLDNSFSFRRYAGSNNNNNNNNNNNELYPSNYTINNNSRSSRSDSCGPTMRSSSLQRTLNTKYS